MISINTLPIVILIDYMHANGVKSYIGIEVHLINMFGGMYRFETMLNILGVPKK